MKYALHDLRAVLLSFNIVHFDNGHSLAARSMIIAIIRTFWSTLTAEREKNQKNDAQLLATKIELINCQTYRNIGVFLTSSSMFFEYASKIMTIAGRIE